MNLALGIILIVASVFLVIAVLMQSSKSHRLSGTIAGAAETFFGKSKGGSMDKKLSRLTTVVAVIFVVLVLVVYLMSATPADEDYSLGGSTGGNVVVDDSTDSTDVADTDDVSVDGEETTAAEETTGEEA